MKKDRFRFRAWNKEEKIMHYDAEDTYDDLGGKPYIEKSSFGSLLEDDRYIVEQCTGLKDKNGKLIFDGDIIELTRSRNYGWVRRGAKLEVTWNTFNCCGFGFGSFGNLTEKCASNCIVVGNIHENPELLK